MSRRGFRGSRGLGGFGAQSFLPTQIAGLQAWYRADLGITIGTGVSAWADQSGNGDANRNATQATGGAQPTLTASDAGYNGRPTLAFAAASSQFLKTGTWSAGPPATGTTFLVGNADGTAANEYFIDGTGADRIAFLQVSATSVEAFQSAALTATTTPGSKHVYGIDWNGATSNIYVDAVTALASGSAGSSAQAALSIGANVTPGGFLSGKIAEILIYNALLTAGQRTQVLQYLGARYGVSIGS